MASDILSGVNVKVQPRSGFDKSRKNILTTKVGTLTPILTDLVIPNTDISLRLAVSAALPPLASETFMRCSLKVEAFFVPMRLLYGGFESWLTGKEEYSYTGTATSSRTTYRAALPRVEFTSSNSAYFGLGTLADYLGLQIDANTFQSQNQQVYANIFPFLAYHKIYDDWYRNTKIQSPVFNNASTSINSLSGASRYYGFLRSLPTISFASIIDFGPNVTFNDGVALGALRQRNYGTDYFTVATPNAEVGAPMTVQVDSQTGLFSIAALRSANSIQQWEELQNLTGNRIQDYCRANYGAKLSSGIAQRAIYLGSADYPVYSKGVYANQGVTATNNPFTTVGARYGSAFASGTDFIVKAHFDEPGIVMVLASLVPEANYTLRASALMTRFVDSGSQVDLPNPMLQNVGNEPIFTYELDSADDFSVNGRTIFGYVPRYTWIKTAVNEVHGILQSGGSLDSFVAKRLFSGTTPQISTNFLQIPTTALNNVTAVTADLSTYGCWIDSYVQYYVSMPLAKYAIPSLQNPAYEHGMNVYLQNNGSKID